MTVPNETTITLTVTEEEARRIERALRARSHDWLSPENINKWHATSIAMTYMRLAEKVKQQYEKQK